MKYEVHPITREDAAPFILNIHYAKRFPSVSYYFGLFRDGKLVGTVTYGSPPSSSLRYGICGKEHGDKVLELNRLVLLDNLKNEASILVGASIRQLPKDRIIVSFADTSQEHVGTVYQATNFVYCGLSAKRTDWKVKGKEHLHGQTISDEFRGAPSRVEAMRAKYGSDFYLAPRPRKHRYIFFHGSRSFKRVMMNCLKYKQEEYPKKVVDEADSV